MIKSLFRVFVVPFRYQKKKGSNMKIVPMNLISSSAPKEVELNMPLSAPKWENNTFSSKLYLVSFIEPKTIIVTISGSYTSCFNGFSVSVPKVYANYSKQIETFVKGQLRNYKEQLLASANGEKQPLVICFDSAEFAKHIVDFSKRVVAKPVKAPSSSPVKKATVAGNINKKLSEVRRRKSEKLTPADGEAMRKRIFGLV